MGICVKKQKKKQKIYGGFFKFCRRVANFFAPKGKYKNSPKEYNEPVIYICRHLNMHGSFTIARAFKKEVHLFILHNFFNKQEAYEHFLHVTYKDKKCKKLMAKVAGAVVPKILNSVQGIPVYRGEDKRAFSTIKTALNFLYKGESLAVFPDKNYKAKYGEVSDIYSGFISLEKFYHKKTGSHLKFIPLYLDDKNRQIVEKEPIVFLDDKSFDDQFETIKQTIIEEINTLKNDN